MNFGVTGSAHSECVHRNDLLIMTVEEDKNWTTISEKSVTSYS